MGLLRNNRLRAGCLILAACLSMEGVSLAASDAAMRIDLVSPIIYCDAEWPGDKSQLAKSLKDGIAVTMVWTLDVDEVRRFWLNSNLATVQVLRKVTPDLLSHSWVLEDQTAGISRRTYSIDEAIHFLVSLDHFPLLDQSLLNRESTYRVVASIGMQEGELTQGWWARLMGSPDFSMSLDFRLP